MNKFEESCKRYKEKYGKNTPKQIKVLNQIKKEIIIGIIGVVKMMLILDLVLNGVHNN